MRGRVAPVQLPLALVVLAAVLDRICFKALQFFRGVQRGFLPFASPFQKELQQSFHHAFCAITALVSLGPSGHDNLDFIWFRII